ASVLGLPVVERRFRDAVLAGQVACLRPQLMLLQNRNDLLFRKPAALHLSVLSSGRTLTSTGGKSQWQVTWTRSIFAVFLRSSVKLIRRTFDQSQALPSYGRGHMFNPCRAHHRSLPCP